MFVKGGVVWSQGSGLDFLWPRRARSGAVGKPESRCMRSGAPLISHTARFGVFLLPRRRIRPIARRRSRLPLNLVEREDISRGLASGLRLREIARRLDRAASTVSREISRNGGRPTY